MRCHTHGTLNRHRFNSEVVCWICSPEQRCGLTPHRYKDSYEKNNFSDQAYNVRFMVTIGMARTGFSFCSLPSVLCVLSGISGAAVFFTAVESIRDSIESMVSAPTHLIAVFRHWCVDCNPAFYLRHREYSAKRVADRCLYYHDTAHRLADEHERHDA